MYALPLSLQRFLQPRADVASKDMPSTPNEIAASTPLRFRV